MNALKRPKRKQPSVTLTAECSIAPYILRPLRILSNERHLKILLSPNFIIKKFHILGLHQTLRQFLIGLLLPFHRQIPGYLLLHLP